MKVLALLQNWNAEDPRMGFVVPWMEKLAARVGRLIILTLEQHQPASASNMIIYSLGKEKYAGVGRYIYYLYSWHQQIKKIIKEIIN